LDEHGSQILAVLQDAGFAEALVATLKSDSAYCVGMAAGALTQIGAVQNGGKALIEASGAITALVHVMKRTRWAREPEKENARYGR
jgi:hypothetical protein